jgi:hypothetical protein
LSAQLAGASGGAINHVETDASGVRRSVLDVVREAKPPFSPDAVVAEYAALLKSYGITRVIGDRYGGMWPRERFAAHGIEYVVADKTALLLPRIIADLEQRSR